MTLPLPRDLTLRSKAFCTNKSPSMLASTMAMMKLVVQLLAATSFVGTVLSFSPTPLPQIHVRSTPTFSRRLPVVQSAKILPFAYGGASMALIYRAAATASKTDKAVLVATAALSLFNLGPTDNARLVGKCQCYPKRETAALTNQSIFPSSAQTLLVTLPCLPLQASAKRSLKRYPSCTPPSAARKVALKWRLLVRMKLVGQLIGLIWMASV